MSECMKIPHCLMRFIDEYSFEDRKEIEVWNGQYSCPNCKRLYGNINDIDTNFKIKNKYCSYCGQLIKWG